MKQTTAQLSLLVQSSLASVRALTNKIDMEMEVLRATFATDLEHLESQNPLTSELCELDIQGEKAFSALQAATERLIEATAHIDRIRSTSPLLCDNLDDEK